MYRDSMVAHAVSTSADIALGGPAPGDATPGGTALQSGGLSPLPIAHSPLPSSPSLSHSVTESLLHSLADPEASLASVARRFNISLASLTLWLARPETQARVREMESGASTHIRLAASLNLSSAVRVLVRILDDFNTLARTNPDPTDADYIRASERARKAAYHLYRLSRLVPISESDLARARTHITPAPARVACLGVDQACPDPTSVPSHGCESAAMPPDRASAPSALKDDSLSPSSSASPTNPPSVALRDLRGESPSSSTSASATTSPSASSAALRVENSSSSPPRSSDSSAFSSLDALNAHLEQLAASLGIDTSDIDVNAPLPPEFLALFPPDVAAFLAPELLSDSP